MLAASVIAVTAGSVGSRNSPKKTSQLPTATKKKRQSFLSGKENNDTAPPLSALERQSLQIDRRSALSLVGATIPCFLLHPRRVLADVEDFRTDGSEQTSTPDRKLQLYVGIRKDFLIMKRVEREEHVCISCHF